MTRSRLTILSLAAATSFVGALRAQEPRPALPAGSVGGFMQPAVVDFVDGELWATQALWKAHFAPDAVHFTPTLGAGAPRSLPVRLELTGIERGGISVLHAAEAGATIEPKLHGGTVRRDRRFKLRARVAGWSHDRGSAVVQEGCGFEAFFSRDGRRERSICVVSRWGRSE